MLDEVQALADEFGGLCSRATVARYVVEALQLMPGVTFGEVIPNDVRLFVRERLVARAQAEGKLAKNVPEVLFACNHNSGRSQLAAALLRRRAGPLVNVRSAGTDPAEKLEPNVVRVLAEVGIHLVHAFPKPLTDEVVAAADVVITMGCGDACPFYPGKYYEDWQLPDPAGKGIEDVRAIRDEIDRRVATLLRTRRLDLIAPARAAQPTDVGYVRLKV